MAAAHQQHEHHEPLSVRELVDAMGGTQVSGQQRAKMQGEVYLALWHVYGIAIDLYDERQAAAILLHLCSRDATFEPEPWLIALWKKYRHLMGEIFTRNRPTFDEQATG